MQGDGNFVIYDDSDQKALLCRALKDMGLNDASYPPKLVLSLLSGVRTEEARPLTWDHIFLETKDGIPPHVAVWRSVRKHGETKTRKTENRMRSTMAPEMSAEPITERGSCQPSAADVDQQKLLGAGVPAELIW